MKRVLLILLVAIVFSPDARASSLSSERLKEMGISTRKEAPPFKYDDFYKTQSISSLKFSAGNDEIYFLKSDGRVDSVFRYSIGNGRITKVVGYEDPVAAYIADPKGRFLAIQKDRKGNELWEIFLFDLRSGKTKRLTRNGGSEQSSLCDISEDGKRIYYVKSRDGRSVSDIMFWDVDEEKSYVLKRSEGELFDCGDLNEEGTLLAFGNFMDNNEIHLGLLDVVTGKSWYIARDKGIGLKSIAPTFVGDELYFISTKGSDKRHIWKYDVKPQRLRRANIALKEDIETFGIFADGRKSAVGYRGELKSEFEMYDGIFEKEKKLEPPLDRDLEAVVFPKHSDDVFVATVSNSHTPPIFYLVKNGKSLLMYDSNKSGIENDYFSKSYSTFIRSFDGLKIPTHFFIPNATSEKNKRPVIVWVHGGPESHVDPVYSSRIQYFVNNGYVVVAPNVRGSSGFGKKYMFMDNGDWGGAHIRDIVEIARHVKGLDFVDSGNVFLVGGSFGGFSVLSLITQYPKVFKAAVDIFGPAEMATFVDSWPAPAAREYWIAELGGDPRKDEALNKRVSPFYRIERIEIPLQMHQGANDIRVPKEQSDMIVEKLNGLGKPVEYHVYSDEGHGFEKFENSKRCYEGVIKFYNAHLKD